MFEFFTKVVEECGVPGVIMICVAGLLYFLISQSEKRQEKGLEEMTDKITSSLSDQNKTLVSTLSQNTTDIQNNMVRLLEKSLYYRDNEKIEMHQQSMRHRLDISDKMQTMLFEMMNFYQARRCGVMEFHNNTNNLNGLSFLWYDLSYENLQRNIRPVSGECKNQQLSMLHPVMSDIVSNDGIVIYRESDIDKLENRSPVLYDNLKHKTNVSTIIYGGLYDLHNNMIGIIFLEYDDDLYPFNESIIDLHDIKERASGISQLLDFKSIS